MQSDNNDLKKAEQDSQIAQFYIKGRQALSQSHWANAVRYLELPAKRGYQDAQTRLQEAYYHWGLELSRKGQLDEAIRKLEAAGSYGSAEEKLNETRGKRERENLFRRGLVGHLTCGSPFFDNGATRTSYRAASAST